VSAARERIDEAIAPARLGETLLASGRRLAWSEWGREDGAPVVFCPGAATSRSLGFGAQAVEELGVRLVSVDRPGLGASDPASGRTLLDWAGDVRDLARDRGLAWPAVVGFSQGAPFALACAAAGVASAVAVVSGSDELAHPAFADALDPMLRSIVDAARTDPASAQEGFASMRADVMWSMVVDTSGEGDRAIYTAPAFARAFRRALDEGFAQGAEGYARDAVLAMAPWPFDVAGITVPVDLWYGALDASPVHSPDHGETLARRICTARRHVLSDAGGALLWTHSAEILRSLVDRAGVHASAR
jgi:pimeloyl-ACP methyl ester carboxylesterase